MKVTIKLFATLRSYLPEDSGGKSCQMEMDEGSTVGQLLDELNVPQTPSLIILVNAVHGGKDSILNNGDTVAVFPPLAGG